MHANYKQPYLVITAGAQEPFYCGVELESNTFAVLYNYSVIRNSIDLNHFLIGIILIKQFTFGK
jgi:hypothetical protein